MKQSFTDFVRSLDPRGEPDPAAFDQVWTLLRRVLRRELRARGLWERMPSYLGVQGAPAWTTPETARAEGAPSETRDALDELVADCYVDVFVERLPVLRRYLLHNDSIDTVVVRRIRQFLHDRQRHHDLLGYRLYQWLCQAMTRAVESGRLHVLEGGKKLDNKSVLAFRPDADAVLADEQPLSEVVPRWNDDLLLSWMTAHGKEVSELIERLEEHVLALADEGVEVFRFQDLADAFKQDFRGRLAALSSLSDESEATVEGDPLHRAVEQSRLDELSKCVETKLDDMEQVQERTRDQLRTLWRFLGTFARTALDPESAEVDDTALRDALQGRKLPSYRELSRLLGIRYDRISELLARLRVEVEWCLRWLQELSEPGTLARGTASHEPEASLNTTGNLRNELLRRTAESYRQADAAVSPPATGPRSGGLYALAGCPDPGIEWLVLETVPESFLVVPVDTVEKIGPADLTVANDQLGLLSVRCRYGVWVSRGALPDDRCVGVLDDSDLELPRGRRRELQRGETPSTAAELEMAVDPDYLDWCRTLEASRDAVIQKHGGRADANPDASSPQVEELEEAEIVPYRKSDSKDRFRRPLALAASVAAVLASGFFTGRLFEQVVVGSGVDLDEPEVAIPWLLAPEARRSQSERLTVPREARSIAVLIDAEDGDILEIHDSAGKKLWSSTIKPLDTVDEVLVRWPATLTPPGRYDIFLWRDGTSKLDFSLLIETPVPPEP